MKNPTNLKSLGFTRERIGKLLGVFQLSIIFFNLVLFLNLVLKSALARHSNMLICGSKERAIVKLSDFNEVSCLKNTYISTITNHLEGKYITYGWKDCF